MGDRTKVKVRSTKTTDKQAEKRKKTHSHTHKKIKLQVVHHPQSVLAVGGAGRKGGGEGGLAELV